MANPRISWNLQGKVLYIGVDSGVQQNNFKIGTSTPAAQKAAAFRAIADLLDPPAFDPRPSAVEQESWSAPTRAQQPPQQAVTPFPPLDPQATFQRREEAAGGFFDATVAQQSPPFQSQYELSNGRYADGSPIRTAVPEDPAEAQSLERLKAWAYERAIAGVADVKGSGEKTAEDLPQVEARPNNPQGRSQPLNSQGLPVSMPPVAQPQLRPGQEIRERPRVTDPSFRFKDTH
jgi:hypothetical protein